ncbi:MAG: NifU family protein [Alphaproteobacteria bacterium]|nr:MAG: NifU family protein [Alphaproteobacteria bacterium]
MFIQTQETPNPNTLKFLPGRDVVANGSMHIDSREEATAIPLANELFLIPEVESVFLAKNFVSVSKKAEADWFIVKADVIATLIDYFSSNKENINVSSIEKKEYSNDISYTEEEKQIIAEIEELIATKLRPMVAADGGDIVFHKYIAGCVYVKLQGACSTCPSATATLKSGVENMLRHYIPEVTEVVSV